MGCLIIGGAGFIGSKVSNMLAETGRAVTVLGRAPALARNLSKKVKYISGNYKNRSLLRKLLRDANEVIDLAYATVPKTSFDNPVYDIISNLPLGVGLLEEASAANLKKFIFVSSGGTVYGVAKTLPIQENHPTNPISPYGITKLTLEKYILMFVALKGLPAVIVRPGNAYGEHQLAFTGQGFIATAIRSILLKQTVNIFGQNGTIRDYVHVEDVARGVVAALEFGKPGEAYNIGTGIGRNNMDVLHAVESFAAAQGRPVQVTKLPARGFDVPANVLDSAKLKNVSNWEPVMDFNEGVQRTWNASLKEMENKHEYS